jgi:hypothetical protein
MRINPRQHTLELWRHFGHAVRQPDGKWGWGGRDEPDSISDAEQLLVLLYPATEIDGFGLDHPDNTEEDVLLALQDLGDRVQIPRVVVEVLGEYLARNTDKNGEPIFGSGSFLSAVAEGESPSEEQRRLDTVEAYSMSITLCLAAAGFTKSFATTVTRADLRAKILEIEESVSRRLTAAMVGMLRSFTLHVIPSGSAAERNLIDMLSQGRMVGREMLASVHRSLEPVRSLLPELSIGVSQEADLLDSPDRLFECGWTWGVAVDAPAVELSADMAYPQPQGFAASRPSLFFTATALDGLADLFSSRTRRLDLLNGEQLRLATALQLRWDLTLQYWSTIARFGGQRWPLEDIPWKTTYEEESEYHSLLVYSILLQDWRTRRTTDDELTRSAGILEELAERGRITRRFVRNDPAVALHAPGVAVPLVGAEAVGPELVWYVNDYSAMLAKRAVQAAGLSGHLPTRERLLSIAEAALDHLWRRRLKPGGPAAGLWDEVSAAVQGAPSGDRLPDWHMNERVMEFLIASTDVYGRVPLRTPRIVDTAASLLGEADHLLGRELQEASSNGKSQLVQMLRRVQANLDRARELVGSRPGTACALALEALRELDELSSARQDVARIA